MKYMILLIIFFGAASAAFLSKKTCRPFRAFLVEFLSDLVVYYGYFSFCKVLLGYRSYTLLQSFEEAGVKTLLVYSPGLIFCAAVLIFLRKKWQRFLSNDFIFCFLPFTACASALTGSVTNLTFCICLAAGVFCDFVFFSYEKTSSVPKKKLLLILLFVSLFYGMTYLLYIPSNIVLSGLAEIPVKYSWILPASLGYFLCGTLLLLAAGWILPAFFCEVYIILLFSLTLTSYLQNNFLNGSLSLMDGKAQAFSAGKCTVNLLIWIMLSCILLLLFFKKRQLSLKIAQYISILFFGSQLVTLGILWITTDYSVQQTDATLTRDGMTAFHEKNNVLVFIVDWFDRQIMDDITAQEPDFQDPLKDFTDYTNTTSCYGFTYMSMPYLLSGTAWPGGMEETEYISYANAHGTFLDKINAMNYSIWLYTDPAIVHQEFGQYVQNYSSNVSYEYDLDRFLNFWGRCARYSLLPFAAKSSYMYTSVDLDNIVVSSNVYKCSNDTLVYHDIADHGITVDGSGGGQFKMIHLFGAHHPYRMTSDYRFIEDGGISRNEQAAASIGIVYEYIAQLKKAGIYDDATIIITADHGQNYFNDLTEMKKDGLRPVSSPILFVKTAGETHDAPVRSTAPVSHEDFIPTVLKALGDPSYRTYGRSFDEIGETEDRTRYFIYGRTPDIPYVKYAIRGNVMDEAAWTKEAVE